MKKLLRSLSVITLTLAVALSFVCSFAVSAFANGPNHPISVTDSTQDESGKYNVTIANAITDPVYITTEESIVAFSTGTGTITAVKVDDYTLKLKMNHSTRCGAKINISYADGTEDAYYFDFVAIEPSNTAHFFWITGAKSAKLTHTDYYKVDVGDGYGEAFAIETDYPIRSFKSNSDDCTVTTLVNPCKIVVSDITAGRFTLGLTVTWEDGIVDRIDNDIACSNPYRVSREGDAGKTDGSAKTESDVPVKTEPDVPANKDEVVLIREADRDRHFDFANDVKIEFGDNSLDKAKGDVKLEVHDFNESDFGSKQKDALKDCLVEKVIEIVLSDDNGQLHEFGGSAKVSIPFAVPPDSNAKQYTVFYVSDEGELDALPTVYENGHLIFETTHFSEYAVIRLDIDESGEIIVPADTATKAAASNKNEAKDAPGKINDSPGTSENTPKTAEDFSSTAEDASESEKSTDKTALIITTAAIVVIATAVVIIAKRNKSPMS